MTIDTHKTAPEIKAVPDTVASAFDEFMEAFEAFRETNDQRLAEVERKFPGAGAQVRQSVEREQKRARCAA